jgi:hypothetical protein
MKMKVIDYGIYIYNKNINKLKLELLKSISQIIKIAVRMVKIKLKRIIKNRMVKIKSLKSKSKLNITLVELLKLK